MRLSFSMNMFYIIFVILALFSCKNNKTESQDNNIIDNQIVILYDNDVHCAVDGYSRLVALRNDFLSKTKYVSTVSSGDYINGGAIGSISKGEFIVDIMNEVGYDVVTLGNHELDYGLDQMFNLTEKLETNVVCSNFINCQTNEYPYPAYHIMNYGDIDVAFIGFTTTSSGTVGILSDENGNPLYSFMRDSFYENAQNFIDEARSAGAEYVVALSHLGDSENEGGHPTSIDLISNTDGLDAVIDAHDHHVIDERFVTNKEGEPVLLTSSGTKFSYVGMLSINTDGTLSSRLYDITSVTSPIDNDIQQFVDNIKETVDEVGEKIIGYSDVYLSVYDKEGNYVAGVQETNIGNFCADAYRSYTSADVAVINAGGIRGEINVGDITFNEVLELHPYGNEIVTAKISGQQLMDALEFSASSLSEKANSFLQVSGMKFEMNLSIPSPVVFDFENDLYSHVGDGKRRVSNIQILDSQIGEYVPIDLDRIYTIASINYLILDLGESGILRYAEPEDIYWTTDLESILFYIDFLGGVIGVEYEDVEGRIVILP